MKLSEIVSALGIFLLGTAALIAAIRLQQPQLPKRISLAPTADSAFELIQLGSMRRDQYLLERRTGTVWLLVCDGTVKGTGCDGEITWQKMRRD
jgi:hypothetical protein